MAPCVNASTHGEIRGTVTSNGALLVGVHVILDGRLESWTDDRGVYVLPIVSPGSHRLTTEAIGYVPAVISGVSVQPGRTTELDFSLTRGADLVPVEIKATASLVGHDTRIATTVLELEEIRQLPVTSLQEAVMTTSGSFAGTLRNGILEAQQTFLDGAVITDTRANVGHEPSINPYMVHQLAVRAGVYDPDYRDGSSGIIEISTPEGGRRFSGSLSYRTLAEKGLNWTSPPPLDLVDKLRTGESSAHDLRRLINTALTLTDAFNSDPTRNLDGLSLRPPFDVLDTTSADPLGWTARYNRDNFYWDYDRIIPEAEAPGFSYLTQGRPLSLAQSGRIDRSFNPEKYAGYTRNNRTEKRPSLLDWAAGGPLGRQLNWFASGRFSENHGRTPNAYNRVINGFGKISYQPHESLKVTMSSLIEDRGAFSGKGQRPELTGDNYLWKYIPEGLNERFLGSQFFNLEFIHAPVRRWYYRMRISHRRVYDESYNPTLGTGPVPTINDPTSPPGISTFEFFGYNPIEGSGIGGDRPGYQVYGDEATIGSSTFESVQPRTTDIELAVRARLVEHHEITTGVRVTLPHTTIWARPVANPLQTGRHGALSAGDGRVVSRYRPREYRLYAIDRLILGRFTANLSTRYTLLTMGGSLGRNQIALSPSTSRRGLFDPRLGARYRINGWLSWHGAAGRFSQRLHFDSLDVIRSKKLEIGLQAHLPFGLRAQISANRATDSVDADLSPSNAIVIGSSVPERFSISGFELTLRMKASGWFNSRMSYSGYRQSSPSGISVLTFASLRRGSDGVFGTSVSPEVFRSRFREHQMVLSATVNLPLDTFATLLTQAQSGHIYYVRNGSSVDPLGLLGDEHHSPWVTVTDLLVQKTARIGEFRVGIFSQIKNLFNRSSVYQIANGERWIRRRDPGSFTGGPLPGVGVLPNTPRDIYVGMNIAW